VDCPVHLDTLALSNMQRFHAEAAEYRLVSAALAPRRSPVPSLGQRLRAMVSGSVRGLRERSSLTLRPSSIPDGAALYHSRSHS
jgi:hypothetical protein